MGGARLHVQRREDRDREQKPAPWPAPAADMRTDAPASSEDVLLSMQQSAGNAAVVQLLRNGAPPLAVPGVQRQPAPAEAP
ncbi:MAG: hypothetical protein AB1416_13480, partial [Actinomycetota bacterium]